MSDVTILTVKEPYLAVGGALLEGPSYDESLDQLRWVDLILDHVFILNLAEGAQSLQKFELNGQTIAALASIQDSHNLLLVGGKQGFATFDIASGNISYFRNYFGDETSCDTNRRFRANDGAIDAKGRIFQGILIDDKVERPGPEGMLVCLDIDGKIRRVVEGVTCPNGLGWNTANTTMYWAESFSGNVYAFDYDLKTGMATGQRVFFHLQPGPEENTNVPDGLVVDEQDHIWLAVWGSSQVLRVSPQGCVVGKIELPTRFVTCPTFAGTDLFITTASERDPEKYPQSARCGGHLFKCSVGIRGLPKSKSLPAASYDG